MLAFLLCCMLNIGEPKARPSPLAAVQLTSTDKRSINLEATYKITPATAIFIGDEPISFAKFWEIEDGAELTIREIVVKRGLVVKVVFEK